LDSEVFVTRTRPSYTSYPFASHDDSVHEGLRALFSLWGRDPDNPFRGWIARHGSVVIKPNWVRDYNPTGTGLDCLITHTSLVKHVIDWAALALEGEGSIVVGDAPLQSCDFGRLTEVSRIGDVVREAQKRYPRVEIRIEDWRLTLMDRFDGYSEWERPKSQSFREGYGGLVSRNYELVDLGARSFLEEVADYANRFRVTCYKPSLMSAHHRPGTHEYLVTKSIFGPDLLVNLPKMKTHIKAGLTGALKNLVGINGHKEYLAHHIRGSYFEGGDSYCVEHRLRRWHDKLYDRVWERYMEMSPRNGRLATNLLHKLWRFAAVAGGDHIDAGSWSGNETIWRTTLDLNHILYFSPSSPKRIVSIVDGVIAGEGEGPLSPTPKSAGLLIGGENPAYVDAVMARLMGYNVSRIPTVYNAIYHRKSRFAGPFLEEFSPRCLLDGAKAESIAFHALPDLRFVKPEFWRRAEASSDASAWKAEKTGTREGDPV
jgi:uncharacterized protein (DUF362 family)